MKKTITLDTFRRIARAEDAMIRSMMPRTAAADSIVEIGVAQNRPTRGARVWSNGHSVAAIMPLTFMIAEVSHVA